MGRRTCAPELSRDLGETSDFPLKQSALEAAGKLFSALRKFQNRNARTNPGGQAIWVEIVSIDIKQYTRVNNESLKLTMKAKARNSMQIEALKNAVAEVDLFTNVTVGDLRTKEDVVEFTMRSDTKKQP